MQKLFWIFFPVDEGASAQTFDYSKKKDLISLQITQMTADKSHLPTGNQSLNTTCFKDALFFLMKYK